MTQSRTTHALTIRAQTTLVLFVAMGLFLVVGMVGFWMLERGAERKITVTATASEQLILAKNVNLALARQVEAWKNILLRGQDSEHYRMYLASFHAAEGEVLRELDKIALLADPASELPALIRDFRTGFLDTGRHYREALQAFAGPDGHTARLADQLAAQWEATPQELLDRLVSGVRLHEARVKERLERTESVTEWTALGLLAILLLLAVGALGMLLDRWVGRPIAQAIAVADRIAEGNLADPIPITRHDEVGHLLASLERMRANLFQSNADLLDAHRATEAANTELMRKERLAVLGQLTGVVSHELRNPLGTLRTSIHTLKQRLEQQGINEEIILGRVDRNIGRCLSIIGEMLEYTREQSPHPRTVAIDWCMETILGEMLEESPVPEGIAFELDLNAPRAFVSVDMDRFRRVLLNLVENAFQAMKDRSSGIAAPPDGARLTVSTACEGEHILVRLTDTGPGIGADAEPHLFEPLFSTKSFGVGLGLTIVKQIVENHGGSITLANRDPAPGAVVTVMLPRLDPLA